MKSKIQIRTNRLKPLVAFFLLFLGFNISFAAVPNRQSAQKNQVLMDLQNPLKVAVNKMYQRGPEGYKILRTVAFNKAYPMPVRWKSLMVMSHIGGKSSLPEIFRALKSSDWFLRNGGLVALENIDSQRALTEAKRMFAKDKALMVRAKALEVLRKKPTAKIRKLLWKKLYAPENYYRDQGLWIRKRIVSYLADHGKKSDIKGFQRIFKSGDANEQVLMPLAYPALERLLKVKPSPSLTPQGKVAFWKNALKKRDI